MIVFRDLKPICTFVCVCVYVLSLSLHTNALYVVHYGFGFITGDNINA